MFDHRTGSKMNPTKPVWLILILLVSTSCAQQLGPKQLLNTTNPFQLAPMGNLEPFMKSLSDGLKQTQKSNPAMKPIFDMILPSTSTTTTQRPATTMSPIGELTKRLPGSKLLRDSFEKPIESVLSATKLLIPGSSVVIGATQGTLNQVKNNANKIAEVVAKTEETKSKKEDDHVYYEYHSHEQFEGYRRPKYFSRNCNLRYACELGKMMRPMAFPFMPIVETNRLIQDLQSRYTRAMTYGALHGDCEKYFCLLRQLMGGFYDPRKFASGMAELVNRLVNPDLYEDAD